MKTPSRSVILALTLLLSLDPIHAWAAGDLKGLKRVFVAASVHGDGVDDCGLRRSQLETTATSILQQSQLQFVDTKSAAEGVYAVDAFVIETPTPTSPRAGTDGNFCAVFIFARLITFGTTMAPYGSFSGVVATFEALGPLSGKRATMPKQAADQLATFTKEFVVRWKKDNP